MSLTLCTFGVSPVSFLAVLTLLSNVIISSSSSASLCSWLSIMFLHAMACLVILLCMLPLIGLSPMPPTYFRVHSRSSIDLLLTCFLSLPQCPPLSYTIWYLGNTVLNYGLCKNFHWSDRSSLAICSGSKNCPNDWLVCLIYWAVSFDCNHMILHLRDSQHVLVYQVNFSELLIMSILHTIPIFPKCTNIGAVFWPTVDC